MFNPALHQDAEVVSHDGENVHLFSDGMSMLNSSNYHI